MASPLRRDAFVTFTGHVRRADLTLRWIRPAEGHASLYQGMRGDVSRRDMPRIFREEHARVTSGATRIPRAM